MGAVLGAHLDLIEATLVISSESKITNDKLGYPDTVETFYIPNPCNLTRNTSSGLVSAKTLPIDSSRRLWPLISKFCRKIIPKVARFCLG